MQIDLKMSKALSEAFFNPRASSFSRELCRVGLLDYATLAARLGTSEGWVRRNARRTYTPRPSFMMIGVHRISPRSRRTATANQASERTIVRSVSSKRPAAKILA
jgi:hypothetical protein